MQKAKLSGKFFKGLMSGGLVAAGAFYAAQGCSAGSLKEFSVGLGLAVANGAFHYVWNWYFAGQPL